MASHPCWVLQHGGSLAALGLLRAGLDCQVIWAQCLPKHYSRQSLNNKPWSSLVVQLLRLHAGSARDMGSIPGKGTTIPHDLQHRGKTNKPLYPNISFSESFELLHFGKHCPAQICQDNSPKPESIAGKGFFFFFKAVESCK